MGSLSGARGRCAGSLAAAIAAIAAIAVIALAAAAPRAQANEAPAEGAWRAVAPPGGAFRALMPGEPRVRGGSRATLLGTVRDAAYTLERAGFELALEHHDVPGIALALVGDQSILERVARGVVGDLGATLLSARAATLAGRPGRALRYEVPGAHPAVEEARIVLHGRRVYVLTARRPRGAPEPEAFARFFDSFELAPPNEGRR